jgi:hypothetical protein
MLSTPIGYALFLMRQLLIMRRGDLLRLFWKHEAARPFVVNGQWVSLAKATQRGQIPREVIDAYGEFMRWDSIFQILLAPRLETLRRLQMMREVRGTGYFPFSGRPVGGTQRYYPQLESLRPDEIQDEKYTTAHLIEGLAIWKEYAFISRLAATSRDFHAITDLWVRRWQGHDLYSRALDAIFAQTGCNACTVLPGILMEIALTCPVFSPRQCAWDEIHPSARFRRILEIAPSLPRHLRGPRPDNLDVIGYGYYQEIESHVCQKLGWTSSIENLQTSLEAIEARAEYGRTNSPSSIMPDVIGRFLDRRFAQAHHHRTQYPGLMLFPWNHPNAGLIGVYTQPPMTLFEDQMTINPWPDEEPWQFELYLKDLVISMALEATVHESETTQLPFRRARVIFSRIESAVGVQRFKTGSGTFEDLLSDYLGFDYRALRRWLDENRRRR